MRESRHGSHSKIVTSRLHGRPGDRSAAEHPTAQAAELARAAGAGVGRRAAALRDGWCFALGLTDLVHTDGRTENVLAVKVHNRLPSSRWYSGSGIYREARLVVTEPVHVERWGMYVTTPEVTEERDAVRVRTSVVNASASGTDVEIVSRIVDPRGRTVARTSSTTAVTDKATETHELTVSEPKLWDFATLQHRYTLKTRTRASTSTAPTARQGLRFFDEWGAKDATEMVLGPAAGQRERTDDSREAGALTPAGVVEPDHPTPPNYPYADASYSGRPDTLPAAMLDGDPATGWSNGFLKAATALLPAFDGARSEDWVSVDFGRARTFDREGDRSRQSQRSVTSGPLTECQVADKHGCVRIWERSHRERHPHLSRGAQT